MKELEKQFTGRGEVKGAEFTQHIGNPRAFVYRVDWNGVKYFEVFKRIENTKYDVVSYPTSKAFGIWAWWYQSLEAAMVKFHELNKRV